MTSERRLSDRGQSTGRSRLSSNSIGERAKKAAGFLLSGDPALRAGAGIVRGVTGGAVDISEEDIQRAPGWVRFLSDTLLSPVGLASVALAPVSGGTSLGLRGAAGAAAKLSTRLLPEVAVSAAATGAAKIAGEALPEDASPMARFAVGLGAGILGGGAAAGGIRAALPAAKAIERASIVETARAQGLKHLVTGTTLDDLVPTIGRDMEGGALARAGARFRAATTIDPSASAVGVERDHIALEKLYALNTADATYSVAKASPTNFSGFDEGADNLVKNVTSEKPVTMGEILEWDDAPTRFRLTPQQIEEWQAARDIGNHDLALLAKGAGLDFPEAKESGKTYIGRVAISKDGREFIRPSDPMKARHWDDQAAAVTGAGQMRYANLRETLRANVKHWLDQVAEKQFETRVLAEGATAPGAARATSQGRIAWLESRRAARGLSHAQRAVANARKEGASPETIDGLIAAVTKAEAARAGKAAEWSKAVDTTWTRLPGKVVGRQTTEDIDVGTWRGLDKRGTPVFMALDDVRKLEEWGAQRGIGAQMPPVIKTIKDIGDTMRFMRATTDFAGPVVQGLPLFAHSPKAWGQMFASNIRSFFDPSVQTQYIQKNFDDLMDMAHFGLVPPGDVEMYAALGRGGAVERLLQKPGIRQTAKPVFERFQAAYDTSLMIARTELWKSLKGRYAGQEGELGRLIRDMTGAMETKGMGLGPNQRALESMLLFAPKMLRSSLAFMGLAARPWTPAGGEAAHTLMRLMAAGAGIMAITNIGIGIANGESEEELDKRLEATLDPTKGRQFLSVQVGDNWYGMGGQFRSMAQLLGRSITDPTALFSDDAFDNPLLRYASGRISPIANIGLAGYELATEEEHNVLPYETVDDFPDVIRLAGTGMMPFFLESLKENDWELTAPLFELVGGRTSLATPKDILEAQAWQRYGMDYDDLNDTEQDALKAANPEQTQRLEELGSKAEKQLRVEIGSNDDSARRLLLALNARRESGQMQPEDFREQVSQALHDRALRNAEARQVMDITYEAADSPKRAVLDAYFQTFTDAGYTPDGGLVDWDKWEELQAGLNQRVAAGEFGPRAQQYLDERRKFQPPPELAWFFDNKKTIEEAGYWEVKDAAYEQIKPLVESLGYDAPTARDLELLYGQLVSAGDPRARQVNRLLSRLQTATDRLHQRMRRSVEGLETALFQNGFIERPKYQTA